MSRVSELFGLGVDQGALDFVDVRVETDNPVYIDPAALRAQSGPWADQCKAALQSFFGALLDAVRADSRAAIGKLIYPLTEPNETHLGVSQGKSAGRSLGSRKTADQLIEALRRSRAAKSGLLEDLDDSALFVRRIGPDIVSDITTCVIRRELIEYTQNMASFYGIDTELQIPEKLWNPDSLEWEDAPEILLPRAENRVLLLVPRSIVRVRLATDGGKYWRGYLRAYLEAEVRNSSSPDLSLIRVLKDRTVKVRLTELGRQFAATKDQLAYNSERFPDAFHRYKANQSSNPQPPVPVSELATILQTSAAKVRELYESVTAIRPGRPGAGAYHRAIAELLTALFDGSLGNMRIEQDLHGAIKRVDIMFDNIATSGFFDWVGKHHSASMIPIECKNYAEDIDNPAIDQLAMRFAPNRGRVGFLVSRNIDDKERAMRRTKAAVTDDHGFVILLDDNDLAAMVDEYEAHVAAAHSGPVAYKVIRDQWDALVGS